MSKLNQQYKYRLTGESIKRYHYNNKKKKLLLMDKLILLFGVLFVFYFITIVIKS